MAAEKKTDEFPSEFIPKLVCENCESTIASACCDAGHALCSLCFAVCKKTSEKIAPGKPVVCLANGCDQQLVRTTFEAKKDIASRDVRLTELKNGSAEYKEIEDKFAKSLPREWISKIYRVVNAPLKGIYDACKSRLDREGRTYKGKKVGANEQLLFHATARQASGGIAREGFDLRRSGSVNGQVYGPGIYLAEDAQLAHSYSRLDTNDQSCMLLVQAILGDCGKRDSNPAMQGAWVVNREQQLFPAFVIYYTARLQEMPDAAGFVAATKTTAKVATKATAKAPKAASSTTTKKRGAA